VQVKPGKPFLFAESESNDCHCQVFGLPGNPVSAFVTFQLFVRPALLTAMGAGDHEIPLPQVSAMLTSPVSNPGNRPHYLRGRHENGKFTPVGAQQSHALFGLSQANAMLRLEAGTQIGVGESAMALLCG
jgi:molybdopterin molybdotransferase